MEKVADLVGDLVADLRVCLHPVVDLLAASRRPAADRGPKC